MDRTMGRANFKDALEALFSHSDFASAFGGQLYVILEEANTLLKTCNTSSVSDTGIQEVLQITHMDMLNTLPKDLRLQMLWLKMQSNGFHI